MGRRSLRKRVRSLERQIEEHGQRISERAKPRPNENVIRHWEAEMRTFEASLRRARKRLGEVQ